MDIAFKDLSIVRDDNLNTYLIPAPWNHDLYISEIGKIKLGIKERSILAHALEEIREIYFKGTIPESAVKTMDVPKTVSGAVQVPLPLSRKEIERRKMRWLPVANPDECGAAPNENTYNRINERPTCNAKIKEDKMSKKVNWAKKANAVGSGGIDANSSTFKGEGAKGDIKLNPKMDAFSPKTESAPVCKECGSPKYKLPAETIQESVVKPYSTKSAYLKRNADEYKDEGTKETLEYPGVGDKSPNVATPGVSKDSIKIPITEGTKETLTYKPGKAAEPSAEAKITEDKSIGNKYKDQGKKETLITSPANDTFTPSSPSQPTDKAVANKYKDKGEVVGKNQKQFSKINWFKRDAVDPKPVTPPKPGFMWALTGDAWVEVPSNATSASLKVNASDSLPSQQVVPGADSKTYKTPGDKGNLSFNPSTNAFSPTKPSQVTDDAVLTGKKDPGNIVTKQQKQFSKINWFKKTSGAIPVVGKEDAILKLKQFVDEGEIQ